MAEYHSDFITYLADDGTARKAWTDDHADRVFPGTDDARWNVLNPDGRIAKSEKYIRVLMADGAKRSLRFACEYKNNFEAIETRFKHTRLDRHDKDMKDVGSVWLLDEQHRRYELLVAWLHKPFKRPLTFILRYP